MEVLLLMCSVDFSISNYLKEEFNEKILDLSSAVNPHYSQLCIIISDSYVGYMFALSHCESI